jgi:hypothetical protein
LCNSRVSKLGKGVAHIVCLELSAFLQGDSKGIVVVILFLVVFSTQQRIRQITQRYQSQQRSVIS